MTGVAVPELVPDAVSSAPSRIATDPSTIRRRRRPVGGSGRFRIAVETFMTLTRQAETATTTSVSSIPSADAMRRLRGLTANWIWRPSSSSAAAERARHHDDHSERDQRSEERADERGEEVVRDPLESEHLDEVTAPRADGARDSELAAPLGGEHHEDQEDQEDAGGDGERAERREERHERVPGLVRVLDRVLP